MSGPVDQIKPIWQYRIVPEDFNPLQHKELTFYADGDDKARHIHREGVKAIVAKGYPSTYTRLQRKVGDRWLDVAE